MNKYDNFHSDLTNGQALQLAIQEIYQIEFNEQFETILLKKEAEFMRYLSLRAKYQIEEHYSNEAFENIKLVTCIKDCEQKIYEKDYKVAVNALRSFLNDSGCNSNSNSNSDPTSESIVFRKHCKYQNNSLIHSCEEEHSMLKLNNKDNSNQIDYLICKKCLCAYKAAFVKLYCNFCYIAYYSMIESEQNELRYEVQPVTWEKYHCNLLFNEQMPCLKCKSDLYLHISKNQLMCLSCDFISDPLSIYWKCVQCAKEFTSNAKIFNPNEYKTMSLAIKDSMFNKKFALPPSIPCGHSCDNFRHKKECNGILYLTNISQTKMVMCSKCNEMTKYDKYIWTCQVCFARFRNNTKIVSQNKNSEIIKKVQFSLHTNKNNPMKAPKRALHRSCLDIVPKGLADPEETKKEVKNSEKDTKEKFDFKSLHSKSRDEEISLSNNAVRLPLFDLSTYEIVSQISTSQTSKLFAVKSTTEKSYKALKRHLYSNETEKTTIIQQYALHYSFKFNTSILSIEALNIDYTKQEISILEELGVDDWESEIVTMKKQKQNYTEPQILSILYQLTNALEYLQLNDYVHCYVNPKNVIIFKECVYKLTDLVYLREVSSLDIIQNDNAFISPNLNKIFTEKKGKNINMIKSEVYSLGLCVIEALTQDNQYQIFSDFVNIDITNVNSDTDIIMKRFEKKLKEKINPNLISNNFISLILKMIEVNENERVDFVELKEILNIY